MLRRRRQTVPNPGSSEAVAAGCACPVDDNDDGGGWTLPSGQQTWDVNLACPLHGREAR